MGGIVGDTWDRLTGAHDAKKAAKKQEAAIKAQQAEMKKQAEAARKVQENLLMSDQTEDAGQVKTDGEASSSETTSTETKRKKRRGRIDKDKAVGSDSKNIL